MKLKQSGCPQIKLWGAGAHESWEWFAVKDGGTAKVSAGSVPLHPEDLIQVHLYSSEDYMATYRCKCQPGFKPRGGEILSSKSGCPEQRDPLLPCRTFPGHCQARAAMSLPAAGHLPAGSSRQLSPGGDEAPRVAAPKHHHGGRQSQNLLKLGVPKPHGTTADLKKPSGLAGN